MPLRITWGSLAADEPLADRLQAHRLAVGEVNLDIIAVREAHGYLQPALEVVMRGRSRDQQLHCELRKEIAHFVLVASGAFIVLWGVLVFAVPKLATPLFEEMLGGEPLPVGTELLMRATHVATHNWWWGMIIAWALGACLIWLWSFRNCQRLHRQLLVLPGYRRQSVRRFEHRWASAIAAFADVGLSRDVACKLARDKCPRLAEFANAIFAQTDSPAGRILEESAERHDRAQAEALNALRLYGEIFIVITLFLVVVLVGLALFWPFSNADWQLSA
jgi:type II secretory pathway component PulF